MAFDSTGRSPEDRGKSEGDDMRIVSRFPIAAAIGVVALGATAMAASIPIVGYDVQQVPQSGCGGWSYAYSGGTATDTGRRMCCQAFGGGCLTAPVPVYDFSGGTGTLADGIIGAGIDDTELFFLRSDVAGQPLQPAITLHLGGTYFINSIHIFGGDFLGLFPGDLTGLTVEIGGASLALPTIPIGPLYNPIFFNTDDLVVLNGTGLDAIATNRIVLRGFTAAMFFGFPLDQISMTEITVDGALAFAGTPGDPDCHGKSVSALARQFGGIASAASALGFASVQALQAAIKAFCNEQ